MRHLFVGRAVLLLLVPVFACGYSAVVTIDELIAESDVIVIAKVRAVRLVGKPPNQVKVATADVSEIWKGEAGQTTIEYIASPGWFACDTSDAKVGETAVLFLEHDESGRRQRIAHFGRGRMRIVETTGHRRAQTYEVMFPALDQHGNWQRPVLNRIIDVGELERIVRTRGSERDQRR